jgi:KipI family sensor histidine kinase inhibitor
MPPAHDPPAHDLTAHELTPKFLSWRAYGDHGVLLEFASAEDVLRSYRICRELPDLDECIPGAVTIYLASRRVHAAELVTLTEARLQALLDITTAAQPVRTHTIDVVYNGEDLESVASLTGLSIDDVVALHVGGHYTVAFLGFSRSFPYLAGLDPRIVVPRLASPRASVPAGSVAMGAGYTGIYPMSSPGGWRLLGHTDAILFDERTDPPNVLATGDRVQFRAT